MSLRLDKAQDQQQAHKDHGDYKAEVFSAAPLLFKHPVLSKVCDIDYCQEKHHTAADQGQFFTQRIAHKKKDSRDNHQSRHDRIGVDKDALMLYVTNGQPWLVMLFAELGNPKVDSACSHDQLGCGHNA